MTILDFLQKADEAGLMCTYKKGRIFVARRGRGAASVFVHDNGWATRADIDQTLAKGMRLDEAAKVLGIKVVS